MSYAGNKPRGKNCQNEEVLFSFVSTSCSEAKTRSNISEDGKKFHTLCEVG